MIERTTESLVRELPDGPIDVVGDVHGDLPALECLLAHLGYDADGGHHEDRQLVFVGDLVDRGPDSPGVVHRVRDLVINQSAYCVLGNHELNLLLQRKKADNGWFYGDKTHCGDEKVVRADEATRQQMLDFFRTLPLVLARDDIRIVHACWQPEMVAMVSQVRDAVEYYRQHRYNIDLGLALRADLASWQREQRHQNLNPIKVLTSGLEIRQDSPGSGNGNECRLKRYPWWRDYEDSAFCFFGHYNQPYGVSRSESRAICVDYGVSRRWVPKEPGDRSPLKWRLAAVRFPEMGVVFDDGLEESLALSLS